MFVFVLILLVDLLFPILILIFVFFFTGLFLPFSMQEAKERE